MPDGRVVLLGVAPGPEHPGAPPLARWTRSGDRLRVLAGLSTQDWPGPFLPLNLLDYFPGQRIDRAGDHVPRGELRAAAERVLAEHPGTPVVCLGRAVVWACRWERYLRRPLEWTDVPCDPPRSAALLPHPSGRCRWWNAPRNRMAAHRFLRSIAAGG